MWVLSCVSLVVSKLVFGWRHDVYLVLKSVKRTKATRSKIKAQSVKRKSARDCRVRRTHTGHEETRSSCVVVPDLKVKKINPNQTIRIIFVKTSRLISSNSNFLCFDVCDIVETLIEQ
ncbi:hypothetical protein QVD17_36387 [Tagetes erecta]|uniref:Secreted protein n=1 Tax=Tagetes erecta TaxID=13708 RepID=A0AAD8JU94_TARER|nr:hypothetical protein QVD17_36387 [Tagetes erecta]